jgi:hypothetical protein
LDIVDSALKVLRFLFVLSVRGKRCIIYITQYNYNMKLRAKGRHRRINLAILLFGDEGMPVGKRITGAARLT